MHHGCHKEQIEHGDGEVDLLRPDAARVARGRTLFADWRIFMDNP